MRAVLIVFGLAIAFGCFAIVVPEARADGETVFAARTDDAARTLVIHSTTDTPVITPLIKGFQRRHANIAIRYLETTTTPLYEAARRACMDDASPADLIISSAVDLQLKLVNDGCARAHRSAETDLLPDWARWRDELFGLTFEPVVMVYNAAEFAHGKIPRTRFDLVDMLRSAPELYRSRIATYDIESSGVGYLFAFEDARQASTFGRLTESFGRSGAQLLCCTGQILDGVADGRFAIGYNVLGSYAIARARLDDRIGIAIPEDYTLILSRAAFIPRSAREPVAAQQFLDFAMSEEGRRILAEETFLFSAIDGRARLQTAGLAGPNEALALKPIAFSPALLVGLDSLKREFFLRQWRASVATAADPTIDRARASRAPGTGALQ